MALVGYSDLRIRLIAASSASEPFNLPPPNFPVLPFRHSFRPVAAENEADLPERGRTGFFNRGSLSASCTCRVLAYHCLDIPIIHKE